MGSEREERNRAELVERARFLFFAEGFARTSMEGLAAKLGASKATLYKYFPNKDALVAAVVDLHMGEIDERLRALEASGLTFKERFMGFLGIIFGNVQPAVHVFVQDAMKAAPREWQRILRFRSERVFPVLTALLNEGTELGLIRRDLEGRAIAPLLVTMIDQMARPELFLELPLSMEEAIDAFARIIFQGILSDSGRVAFDRIGDIIHGAPSAIQPGAKGPSLP